MSKQKVVSSLLLSTVVLGGLAFYSTTTVKAESLEPDVTSVNASDATNKPVVSNEEESDFLAEEEEFEESDAPVETLNEEIKDVTEPEALLQPRAMMGNSTNSGMEEIPLENMESEVVVEKVTQNEQIQASNADSKSGKDQEKLRTSVSINLTKVEKNEVAWEVNFDTSAWSFDYSPGGLYFILPKGLKLTSIKNNAGTELFNLFPDKVESSNNNPRDPYRFFSKEENSSGDRGFNDQWGWSAGQVPSEQISKWKIDGRMSKIYFIDNVQDKVGVTYKLVAQREDLEQTSFPLVAVMKSFKYANWQRTEITSLSGREILIEKTKVQKPKEEAPKTNPEPEAPSTPEKQPESPKEDPKPDAPQDPSTPEEKPQVPEEPKQEPDAPSPEVPTPKEEPAPTPKEEDTPAPKGDAEAPKDEKEVPAPVPTPDVEPAPTPKEEDAPAPKEEAPAPMPDTPAPKAEEDTPTPIPETPKAEEDAPTPVPDTPVPAPAPKEETQEPKTEEKTSETKKETPAPAPIPEVPQVPDAPKDEPQVPSIPEEQPKETPTPEVPKQEDVQPEAPKSDEVESDKQMPETKQPDMKQPKADDMPKEQKPKADEPKAEQPQMDKPQMEAPKKDSEAPKSDKVETDKQLPETKQPDMKQPKADDMPKEQKPKADEPKAEQPQMDKPQMEAPKKDSEAPKSDKVETDKPMPETKQPDMKQPKADKPEAEKAQMPRTEGMKSESKASMMPKAEAPKATLPNTGEASSAIGWLGGALATLATGLYLFKNKKEE
ncbi:Translation initiation factor 2 (IF-2; GTPase) [Streptococcus suis]|uniref:LPXTG cell wall anchor domain-containing protein n=3 Tax=Streptococcus suis TaxID=1307 RepID=UPI0010E181F6|nr:LPXTG cell wall anchor domain-containing protein [Streptococcus suis]VTT13219.1 Translation initiation factor 2 (IF-2; GTPase) [Streptococcus suis]HEM4240758.1 LPXTG cell wall anchor domain-containing protein [Streptococcus suis]HEM5403547.1 LPXTG cell wall anchor domain-containing protein [Streptococcus suis]